MIITQTPFRMSFFGGGTDMESFFRENGGSVLSTTFDKYCYVNVRHLPRFFDYSTELSYSKTKLAAHSKPNTPFLKQQLTTTPPSEINCLEIAFAAPPEDDFLRNFSSSIHP